MGGLGELRALGELGVLGELRVLKTPAIPAQLKGAAIS